MNKIWIAVAAYFLVASQLIAAPVNIESFSVRPSTYMEAGNRLALNVVVCGNGISVDGQRVAGQQCARVKVDKKPGRSRNYHIIFESSRFTAFPLITRDNDNGNYKFWLRERQNDDTQNFSTFLREAPDAGTAVVGAICKKLSDSVFLEQVVVGAVEQAELKGRLASNVMEAIKVKNRQNHTKPITRIARRCYKTAERHVGAIFVTTGTTYAPEKLSNRACGYRFIEAKSHSELSSIQRGLAKRNLYGGSIDGKFGKGSCEAFKIWAKCELGAQPIVSERAINKLMQKSPSARELSCYGNKPSSTIASVSSSVCSQSNFQIRLNQNALKGLDLYTSKVDGISGPNYRKAVASGEKLLGQWSDESKDCLSVSERKILEAVVAAQKIGSQCKFLPNSSMVENAFTTLSAAGLAKRNSIDHQSSNGVIWMINTSSELEKQLMQRFWYGNNTWGASNRDCRLDAAELSELVIISSKPTADAEVSTETKPDTIDAAEVLKEHETFILAATTISMSAVKRAGSATLSLIAEGSDLETSLASKSIFGLNNQIEMDIKFDMSGGSPILDFIVSENDTKINLHFYDNYSQSAGFAAGLKELTLGKTQNDQSAFRIRMLDSGKSNIDNGDFRKLLSKMPGKDHAMISALCGHVAGVSTSAEGFEAQFSNAEDKATFRSSLFSNPQVRSAVNKLATQCVTEVRATGAVEASFKMTVPPIVCTAAENDGLASLNAQIAADQESLLGVKDEINQLQSQRPLFQFKECAAYADNSESAAMSLEILQKKVVQAELETKDATTTLDAGRALKNRLADLKAPADICLVENETLREDVNEFVFELDPVFVGIQCPGLDDAPKNPVQIVINEINAEILALLEVHISEDEIAALEAERDDKLQEFRELAARLAAIEQSKASPEQVQEQTDTNASLRQTIDDIEARIVSLENEIRDLNGILANNAGMIEDIDALNQRLVELSAQKERRQIALDETKSTSLGALAVISQRDLEISKLEDQISNLKIQMEAASSTSSTLVEEVVQLGQDIADTTQRVTTLEANVSEAQALIDNANGAIGQKSQEVSNLDAELSKKVAEATILSNSVTTLAPQADAAETTVEGMRASLETDYAPIAQFQEKAARLNELTQAVTERTKLIQELRLDLGSIEQEEQLLIKMCVADAQCKAAMGERLGVDQ
ncbi:hypothetical protein N8995_02060 [Planktomarina temperata]|nr:hypothetical protein [Planktomarina temperata]